MRGTRLMVGATLAFALLAGGLAQAGEPAPAEPKRIKVSGEFIDSWCYLSQIMYAQGSAHHQCAVWCARGGVPVGILGEDHQVYVVIRLADSPDTLENPQLMRVQTNHVTVEGQLYERDQVKYLAIDQIIDDQGIVNFTHTDHTIQPFGE